MKNPTLGLALSTVAFAASTLYLGVQLAALKNQSEATQRANDELAARIAALQEQRAETTRRQGADRSLENLPGPGFAPPPQVGGRAAPSSDGNRVWTTLRRDGANPPPMPDAMLKMMRANMRAQNKRLYFDLQSKLGLTDEQAGKLLDLITEEHSAGFKGPHNLDPQQARDYWEAEEARRKAAIEDLLGPAKAAEFAEYQKTMASRSELMMISQQLEGVDTPLSDDQRARLLDALIAERERIPMPTLSDSSSPQDSKKAYDDWQADYERRVADAARGILSADQLRTYDEYQQWQRELRQQLVMPDPRGGPLLRGNATFLPGGPPGSFAVAIDSASGPTETPPDSK